MYQNKFPYKTFCWKIVISTWAHNMILRFKGLEFKPCSDCRHLSYFISFVDLPSQIAKQSCGKHTEILKHYWVDLLSPETLLSFSYLVMAYFHKWLWKPWMIYKTYILPIVKFTNLISLIMVCRSDMGVYVRYSIWYGFNYFIPTPP